MKTKFISCFQEPMTAIVIVRKQVIPYILGSNGWTIRKIETDTNCKMQFLREIRRANGDTPLFIEGPTEESVRQAEEKVHELVIP